MRSITVVVLLLGVVSSAMAQGERKALPYPHRNTPKAVDMGGLKAHAGTEPTRHDPRRETAIRQECGR